MVFDHRGGGGVRPKPIPYCNFFKPFLPLEIEEAKNIRIIKFILQITGFLDESSTLDAIYSEKNVKKITIRNWFWGDPPRFGQRPYFSIFF